MLSFILLQEFNECKEKLVENIDEIIKAHPTFSTAKLAQKCFVNKTKCNEYHSKGGVVLTLRDLNQQVTKDTITNLDQLKFQIKAMGDRLNSFIKPELATEAKTLIKKLVKATNEVKLENNAKPVPVTKPVKPVTPQTPKVGRRGRSGQPTTDANENSKDSKDEDMEKENVEVDVPKKPIGRSKRLQNANTGDSPENEDMDKLSLELTQDIALNQASKEDKKDAPRKGRGRGRGRGKENEIKEEKVIEVADVKPEKVEATIPVVVNNANSEEPKTLKTKVDPKIPNAVPELTLKPAATAGRGKRKAPEKTKEESTASVGAKKVKGNEIIVQNTLAEKTVTQNKKVSKRQNKKATPMIAALPNTTKIGGVSLLGKGMPQLPTTPLPISMKKTVIGSILPTKMNMGTVRPGGKVVNIASLLPTSPNPRMHSPTQLRPGGQQLIQIRPGNVQIQSQGPSLSGGNIVQVRPPNSLLNAISNTTLRPQQIQAGSLGSAGSIIGAPGGPQFFKIIGGKPVQLGGAAAASLANSTSAKLTVPTISGPAASTAGQGPRIVYVRKGPGGNAIPVGSNTTSLPITSTATITGGSPSVSGSPSKLQNKIILVSNKNQIPGGSVSGKGGHTLNTPQGVVKLVGGPGGNIVASGGTQLAPGILSSLRPVAVSTSGSGTKASSSSGPVLLRTVMPKPQQASVFQKAIQPTPSIIGVVPQLPNVPIPKSKLNAKTATTSSAGTRTKMSIASSATSVEQLLPKRPIPQQKVSLGGGGHGGPPPPKIFKRVISGPMSSSGNLILPSTGGSLILPSNMIPSPPTSQPLSLKQPQQQVTTISGPFVWKNSSQTNFKLSSRINFASFAKFKESQVAAEAAAAAVSGSNKKESGKKSKGKGAGDASIASNEEIHFTLATIVTDDKSNEFTFRLNLKNDPKDPKGTTTFLELEARSKKPHNDHKWNLKVKTNPERYLVSGGCFKTDDAINLAPGGKNKTVSNKDSSDATCAFRIPKEISDLKFVDYELQIDKVLVIQQTQPALSSNSPSKAVIITTSANKVSTSKKTTVAAK